MDVLKVLGSFVVVLTNPHFYFIPGKCQRLTFTSVPIRAEVNVKTCIIKHFTFDMEIVHFTRSSKMKSI